MRRSIFVVVLIMVKQGIKDSCKAIFKFTLLIIPLFFPTPPSTSIFHSNTLAIQKYKHYLFRSNMNKPTMSTFESQPPPTDKKSPPPLSNGAPLNADKNRRKGPARLQSHYIWGDSLQSDLYISLLKILKDETEGPKLQNLILNHRDNTQDLLRSSLLSFSSEEKRHQLYDNEYSKKQSLGLGVEQLGFKKGAIINQSVELSSFWKKLIETTAVRLGTNRTIAYKIVRKYVKASGIFKRLYDEDGGPTLKPKLEQVAALFKAGGKEIEQDSVEFKVLFTQILSIYFEEINSCIYCLTTIFDPGNVQYDGLRSLFAPKRDFSMVENMWKVYVEVSKDVLASRVQGKSAVQESLRVEIFSRKIKLLLNLIKLFYTFLTSFSDNPDARKAPGMSHFHEQMVEQLDRDIIEYEKASICCGVNNFNFSRFVVQLFLLLFPFESYINKPNPPTTLGEAIRKLKSEPLRLVRVLLADEMKGDGEKVDTKRLKEFEEIARSGQWSAYTINWKEWLGIFLLRFKGQFKRFDQQLARRVILLCKRVVSQEYDIFWGEQCLPFYLGAIQELLTEGMAINFQDSTNYGLVLPICTKLMGNISKPSRYSHKVIKMLDFDLLESIFSSVTFALKVDQERGQGRERVVYPRDEDKYLEHKIKFICKLVELEVAELSLLEDIFLKIEPLPDRKESGTMLVIKLFQIFFSIIPETACDLKCLRYLLNALNSIFVYTKTRDIFCIALAAVEGGKVSYPKALRAITSRCYDFERTNELGRQAEKLRNAISYHLNCITRISDSLEQYFPTTTQREVVHKYRTLQEYLQQENVDHSYIQIAKIAKPGEAELKSVSWFYEFAKLMESGRLTSVDLNTISLLLMKMRIKNIEAREYANLSVIVDIFNNGRLQDIILSTLTPLAKRQRNRKEQERHFLGLANKEIEGFMTRPMAEYLNAEKYSNHAHKQEKQRNQLNREKTEQYCKLSGCLTIIETILRLRLEGDFPLLKKIGFYNAILDSLFGEKPHIYKVSITVKMEKAEEKRDLGELMGKKVVEQEMESSISLLHCIASLWNIQGRLQMDETLHPSYNLGIKKGALFSDFIKREIRKDIFFLSQENVLTNFTRTSQSLGIGTVGKILEYSLLLGFGKKLYYSIISRSYPLTKGLVQAGKSAVMDEFMGGVLKAASHQSATIGEKRQVIELLSVMIQQPSFGEYIRSNIFKFKEAISQGKEFAIRSTSIHLIAQFLLFLNLLLNIDSSQTNVRFAKSCLADPIEFGKKLLDHCRNRLQEPDLPVNKQSKYLTFEWSLTLRQGAICKLALLLFLGVTSYLISSQHSSLAIGLCNLVISKSEIFLKKSNFDYIEQEEKWLDSLELIQVQHAPELIKGNTHSSLIVDEYFLNAIFLNNPFSFAENYMQQPWEVMQKCIPRQAKRMVLAAHRVNSANALHYAGQAMIQFYYLLLSSIFQRGHKGLFFLPSEKVIHRPTQLLLFRKEKAKNELSSKLLFGEDEGFLSCCFRICRDLERQIWEHSHNNIPRDIGLSVIKEILTSIERAIADEPHHLPDCQRLADKLASQLKGVASPFNFTVLASAIQSFMNLANRLLMITSKKSNIKNALATYFQRVQQGLDILLSNMTIESLGKLSEEHLYTFLLFSLYLFNMEIDNIEYFQNEYRAPQKQNRPLYLPVYLENGYRFSLLEKMQKIFKSSLSLLNNPKSSPQTTALVLQICNKGLYIDFQSKKSAIPRIVRSQTQVLFSKLEKIGEKLGYEDVLVSTYIGKFIMEVSVFAEPEQNRQVMRIVKAGFNGMEHRLKKVTEVKSLNEIQQCSNLIGAFASLAMEEQHWRNEEFSGILDKIFLVIQEKSLRFDFQKIVPEEQLEGELHCKQINTSNRCKFSNIFTLYSSLCMYEMARNFLFFLSYSLTSSPTLHQFCSQTFNKGLLEDLSLDRMRQSLNNVINFLTRFLSQFFNNDIEEILKMSNFASFDYEFLKEMNLAPLCFERYPNKEDFHTTLADTIILTNQSIQLLCQTWQRYDWKATSDWRPSKTDLLKQFQKLLQLYRGYFKDYKQQLCDRRMQGLEKQIKRELDGFNF